MDFGSVVLSWWLKAARQLLEGEPEGELVIHGWPLPAQDARSIGNHNFLFPPLILTSRGK